MEELKIFDEWNSENILEFEQSLENDDVTFREFNRRIVNTPSRLIGVRVPELHKIAKKIASSSGADSFIALAYDGSFELTTLRGLVIAYAKNVSEIAKIELIDSFIESIDNWATNDVVSGAIKLKSNEYKKFLFDSLISSDPWRARFGIVSLMNNYMRDSEVESVISEIVKVKFDDDYYVDMAIAWAISVAYVRDRIVTEKVLSEYALSERVLRKSVSKICDSRRVSTENKLRMKELLKRRLTI